MRSFRIPRLGLNVKIEGIRKYYPKIPVRKKFKAAVANARPFTLLLPIVGGWLMVEASLGRLDIPTPNPIMTWTAILAMALVNAMGNYCNSIFDVGIDLINKPYRPIPSGVLSIAEASVITAVLLIGAITLSVLVNPTFFVLSALSVEFSLVYSMPPLRTKRILWANNITQAVVRGLLGPLAMWSIYQPITSEVLGYCVVAVTLIMSGQSIKDLPDIRGDKAFNIRTIPVVYGTEKTKQIIAGGVIASMVELLLLAEGSVIRNGLVMLPGYILLSIAFVYYMGRPKESLTENTIAWNIYYFMMIALIGGFALARFLAPVV